MKNSVLYIYSLLFLIAGSCKKTELPSDQFGSPVFQAEVTLDSLQFNLTAGDEDYYMFADYSANDQQYLVFSGSLSNEFDDFTKGLRFEITDLEPLGNNAYSYEEALDIGDFVYKQQDLTLPENYFGTLTAISTDTTQNAEWVVDSIQYFGNSINVIVPYSPGSAVSVTLKQRRDSLEYTLNQNLNLSSPSFEMIRIQYVVIQSNPGDSLFTIEALPAGSGPYNYVWDNGSTTSIQQGISPGFHFVTVTDTKGNAAISSFKIAGPIFSDFICGYFDQNLEKTPGGPNPQPGSVTVIVRDAEGMPWRSDLQKQSGGSFMITSASPYELNEKGHKTRKLEVAFDCDVVNIFGEKKRAQGTGAIAVAHPD